MGLSGVLFVLNKQTNLLVLAGTHFHSLFSVAVCLITLANLDAITPSAENFNS